MSTIVQGVPDLTVNTKKVVAFLSFRFRQVTTAKLARDDKRLKALQVDFSYLIDEVERGPEYQFSKAVADVNLFIQSIE